MTLQETPLNFFSLLVNKRRLINVRSSCLLQPLLASAPTRRYDPQKNDPLIPSFLTLLFMYAPHRYFMLHKPYGMESQFISPHAGPLLGHLPFSFPEGTHAIGRLDKYSEGLLLLTTDKRITALLFEGHVQHKRTYLVQVKHLVSEDSLAQLRNGVAIRITGEEFYTTPPCAVDIVHPSNFPP